MQRTATVFVALIGIAAILGAQSEEFGAWKPLFNGTDTTGWVIAKGENAGKPPARWSVADGALTNGQNSVYDIATADEFDNYELQVEYRVPPRGNSGVYLRGQIEVQVADSFGKTNLGEGDAGGIYSKARPLMGPGGKNPQHPSGEWNRFAIRHIGNRVMVWHNDVLVQDDVYVDAGTGGALGKSPTTGKPLAIDRGPIMLQGDHSKVDYRAIKIRPLASGEGWRPIWNGKDLSAFTSGGAKIAECWEIKDNALTNKKWGGTGGVDMWTAEKFGNFLVHYEYKSDPKIEGGNSGFYLRDQWEIQILRETTTDPHSDGSLYSLYAPCQIARNGPDNWNHMDVKVDGVKIWIWQNGKLIHDGKVCATRTDDHGRPTPAFSVAPFKFQGDHGKVWFTNLYIKPLPATK